MVGFSSRYPRGLIKPRFIFILIFILIAAVFFVYMFFFKKPSLISPLSEDANGIRVIFISPSPSDSPVPSASESAGLEAKEE